ncbi:MAG: hemerythrin domain-containing protein [Burkholderiaceae bacterium]|nr:MAG: hemerythrin domain-containing protein [Burkholderiaceae bacterium]
MESINDYMMNDHREVDAIFERARNAAEAADWAGVERDGEMFLRRIERHIEMEEKILFPAFDEVSGMSGAGPSQTMSSEHELMRPMFTQMREATQANNMASYLQAANSLHELLQQHNMKEEQMMYPMADQALGQQAAQSLVGELKKRALVATTA